MLETRTHDLGAPHCPSPARELVEANVRLERRVGELLAVQELAQTLAGELRLDALLEIALSTVASLTGARAVSILLPEPGSGRLAVRARRGGAGPLGPCEGVAAGEGLAGWVARHQVPLLLPDVETQPQFAGLARAQGYESGSFVGVPLLFQERLLGVVCVAERAGGLPFHERDLRVLISLAPYLAIGIRNATVYSDIEDRALAALHALAEAARQASTESDSTRLLHLPRPVAATDGGGSED
ncbi:MAG TPA: GAF domain-containing protein [Planctomycetota bacterium]|nr:GAF domain-containing protein [Planctomycetota bacterium]